MANIPAKISCVWQAGAVLGEGPYWSPAENALYWVDIKSSKLKAWFAEAGQLKSWQLPFRLCSIAAVQGSAKLNTDGAPEFVGCGDPGFIRITLHGDEVRTEPICLPAGEPQHNRFNDGKFGPDGRYWAGTMDDREEEPLGRLYAFTLNGEQAVLDEGYMVPNGPAFSPDGKTVYHTDSARQKIYAFELGSGGTLQGKRLFLQFAPGEGYPDGMTTDQDGNLWVAVWDGWRIDKISPAGVRLGSVSMPTSRVTSCVFSDAGTLWATSASIGLTADDELAGSLFKVEF